MQSIRRSLSFAGLSLMAMALTFAACTDDGQSPTGPEPLPPTQPPLQTVAIECKASIKSLGMKCEVPRGSAGAASGVILAEQRVDVEVSSNDLVVTADTFAFDVNVTNVFPQPTSGPRQLLGVDSLEVKHPIQVFLHKAPLAQHGGSVDVENADGMGAFTNGGQLYFEYPVMALDSGEVSPDVRWKFLFSPDVDSLTFTVMVSAAISRPTGWVDVSPVTDTLLVDSTTTFTGIARTHTGQVVVGEPISWRSSDTTVATVHPSSGVVTAVAGGTAVITASTPTPGRYGTAVVVVSNALTFDALENVTATVAAPGLKTKVSGTATIVAGTVTTANGGTVMIESTGSFRFSGAAGFKGSDSFQYAIVQGGDTTGLTATVKVDSSRYWYVQAGATGNGRQASPFGSVAAAQAAAIGPDQADSIFVLYAEGAKLTGAVVLDDNQSLIGEGIDEALRVPMNGAFDTIIGKAGTSELTSASGATVTLAKNNLLLGLGITATDGAAITGKDFGNLTVRNAWVRPAGPALHLTNGSVNAMLDSLASIGSATEGLFLSNIGGSLVANGGSIANAGTVGVHIVGGTPALTVTYGGNIGSNGQGALISGHTGGALSFAGNVTAPGGVAVSGTAGGAVSFSANVNAAGAVGVSGTTGGSVTFGAAVTAAGGVAVSGTGGAAEVKFLGAVTETGEGISLTGNSGGTVTFGGALDLTRKGILAQNNTGGGFAFTGSSKTIDVDSTAYAGVVLATNPGASFRFGNGNLKISTATGAGFSATGGGTVIVEGANNTVSTSTGTAVTLNGVHTGATADSLMTFASVTTTGVATTGISLNAITGAGFQVTGTGSAGSGGTINATGTGVVLTAPAATPVVPVVLTNLNVTGTGPAAAFSASGPLSVTVNGVVVNATGGPALSLVSSSLSGTFGSLASTASTSNAVILNDAAGSFSAASGSLAGAAATTVAVVGGTVGFTHAGTVTQGNNAALLSVTAGHTGSLSFSGAMTATAGTGLQFNNADGTYDFTSTVSLNGGDAGIDIIGGSGGNFGFGPNVSVGAVTSPSGTAFTVNGSAANVVFSGNLRKTNAGLLVDVTDHPLGKTMTFQTGTIQATAGDGIQLSNADGTVNFTGTVSLGGGNAAVDVLNGSAGTILFLPATDATQQTITEPSGEVIRVLNSSPAFTYAGSFTKTNAGTGILVQGSGGTVTISGDGSDLDNDPTVVVKTLSTTGSNAVNLLNNSGTVTFQGGGLAITTTTGTGFNATGSGTVNVTGAANAITSTGGVGVNVQNVDVGASGVFFRKVTATGAANGIVLVNTGNTGGNFKVTGDGVAPTAVAGGGGTIQVTSGGDGGVAGNGVYLQNARNVSLDWINFTGSVNHAVRGVDVVNFTMHRARVTGTHGNNAAVDESAVFFSNLSGAASITASNISGSIEDNLRFVNNTGTLNRLVLDGDTVGPHDTAEGNDGVYIESGGSAVVNATIQNSRFTSARGDWLNVNVVTTGKADLVFAGNTLTNNHPNILGGGGGTTIAVGGSATLTYSITNNSFRDSKGSAIVLFKGFGGGAGTGVMSGTVSGNVIGVNGVANSASTEGSGIAVTELARGTHTVRIHGNQIRGYNNHGILLTAGGAATSSTGLPAHDGVLNATITGNTIGQPGNLASIAAGKNGVHLNAGTNAPDAYNVCLKLGGAGAGEANSITGAGSAEVATATDFRFRNRIATTVRLPGYAGANNDNAAVTSFVQGRNPVSPTGIVSNNVAGGAPGFVGGADCTLP